MFERFTEKAIDLIDEAGSRVRLRHSQQASASPAVSAEDIAQVVSAWTGDMAVMDIDDDGQVQVQPKQSPALVGTA